MTSLYSLDNPYYLETPITTRIDSYRVGSVMNYIYKHCPVFAYCLQKTNLDEWVNSADFNSTCFVPTEFYSKKYYHYFCSIDYDSARKLLLTNIIREKVPQTDFYQQEYIPNYNKGYIRPEKVSIISSAELDNGIVHLINNGFIPY